MISEFKDPFKRHGPNSNLYLTSLYPHRISEPLDSAPASVCEKERSFIQTVGLNVKIGEVLSSFVRAVDDRVTKQLQDPFALQSFKQFSH